MTELLRQALKDAESLSEIDTLVIGAGQAGIAASEHLSNLGIPHVVLEQHRKYCVWNEYDTT